MMLLHRPFGTGSVKERVGSQGRQVRGWQVVRAHRPNIKQADKQHRGKAAQERVQRGQVSRARHELTDAKLAPKDEATLNELRNRRPQEQLREIPGVVLNFQPKTPVHLDRKLFVTSLRPVRFFSWSRRLFLRDVESLVG